MESLFYIWIIIDDAIDDIIRNFGIFEWLFFRGDINGLQIDEVSI